MRNCLLFLAIFTFLPRLAFAQSEQICKSIKANPKCEQPLALMKQVMGLSVQSCKVEVAALKCEAFVTKFPQFRSHLMSCEPYEVCKAAVASNSIQGCLQYGIEIKNQFVDTVKKIADCDTNPKCVEQNLLLLIQSGMMLSVDQSAALRLGQKTAMQMVNDLKKDRARIRKIACLDAETQAQFMCSMYVKYGGAVVGAASGAAGAGELLMARMGVLEADVVADTVATVDHVPPTTVSEIAHEPPIIESEPLHSEHLDELQNYLNGKGFQDSHVLTIGKDGKGYLKIDFLRKGDLKFSKLMAQAVRDGSIAEIDAGAVVGPKVLILLHKLQKIAPKDSPLIIQGNAKPSELIADMHFQEEAFKKTSAHYAEHWSNHDISDFQSAVNGLRLPEACAQYGRSVDNCDLLLRFTFDARYPESIHWYPN